METLSNLYKQLNKEQKQIFLKRSVQVIGISHNHIYKSLQKDPKWLPPLQYRALLFMLKSLITGVICVESINIGDELFYNGKPIIVSGIMPHLGSYSVLNEGSWYPLNDCTWYIN